MRGTALHDSHALYHDTRTGYWFCWVCGAVAKSVVRELAYQCPGALTGNGADNLGRLDKGLYPGTGPEARAHNKQYRKGRGYDTGVTGRICFFGGVPARGARGLPGQWLLPRPPETTTC